MGHGWLRGFGRSALLIAGLGTAVLGMGQGYSDPQAVADDVVATFLTMNDDALDSLCVRLAPSKAVMERLRDMAFSYQGIPERFDAEGGGEVVIADRLFEPLQEVRDRMHARGLLRAAVADTVAVRSGFAVHGQQRLPMQHTVLHISSGTRTIQYSLGELVAVDGRWYLFTMPAEQFRALRTPDLQ